MQMILKYMLLLPINQWTFNFREEKWEVLNTVQSAELLTHLLANLPFPNLLLNCCAHSKTWGATADKLLLARHWMNF